MGYEDSNRELRIRQRSILSGICILGYLIGLVLATLSAIIGGYIPIEAGILAGGLLVVVFWYVGNRRRGGTYARRLHTWLSDPDDVAPKHELDLLQKRAKEERRAISDGGDG